MLGMVWVFVSCLKACKTNTANTNRGHNISSHKVLCNYELYSQFLLCSRHMMRQENLNVSDSIIRDKKRVSSIQMSTEGWNLKDSKFVQELLLLLSFLFIFKMHLSECEKKRKRAGERYRDREIERETDMREREREKETRISQQISKPNPYK